MSKLLGFALTTVLLCCTGCVLTQTESKAPTPVATTTVQRPPSPPVTANQVTVENCHRIATKLGEELDREAREAKLNAESQ